MSEKVIPEVTPSLKVPGNKNVFSVILLSNKKGRNLR